MANDVKDPALLRRSELQNELERRKIEAKGTVRELVELLRQHSKDPTHKITQPQEVSLAASAIAAALEEILEVIQGELSPTASQVRRLQARFHHYVGRRNDLVGVDEELDKLLTTYINSIEDWLQNYSSGETGANDNKVMGDKREQMILDTVFSKLQNPLQDSMNICVGLSLNSVEDIVRVLHFTVDFQHQTNVMQISCTEALRLVAVNVKERLREETEQAIQHGLTWKQFREQICCLIPERVLHEIVYREYWRQQGNNETVVSYVLRVKQSVRAFELGYPEGKVVRHILSGFNTATRQRAVFCQIPTTFRELEAVVNHIQELEILDGRKGMNSSITGGEGQLEKGSQERGESHSIRVPGDYNNSNRSVRRREITCWSCGESGHIKTQCSKTERKQQL